jgi:hypothetical protein
MKTAEKVTKQGLYASFCCGRDRIYDQREVFQRCPKCERLCEWEFIERVVDCNQLDGEAA